MVLVNNVVFYIIYHIVLSIYHV